MFDKDFYFACFDPKRLPPHSYKRGGLEVHGIFLGNRREGALFGFCYHSIWVRIDENCTPSCQKCRGSGIRCVVYIDDGNFGSPPKRITVYTCLDIRGDLENAGFTINEGKSRLYPVQVGKWLGFIIDTFNYQFTVPEAKIEKLCRLRHKHTTARRVATTAGRALLLSVMLLKFRLE